MWNQWKYLRKWLRTRIIFDFGAQYDLQNWTTEADIQHTSKSSSNCHVKQDLCETSGNVLRKWPKDRNFYIFWGPKRPINWTSDAHIPHTAESSCNEYVKQYVKSVKTFWESDQNIDLLLDQKWSKKWVFEAHNVHIFESSSNEYIK